MHGHDVEITVRRGRLTLPASLRRQAGLADEARLRARVVDGAFVLYEEVPSFLEAVGEKPVAAREQPLPFESAVCEDDRNRLRALECIPARNLEEHCAEAVRLVMSDLRLMGAGITVFDRAHGILHAAFTSMDGYLVLDELMSFMPQSRQILALARRVTWVREPWKDARVRIYDGARLPHTSAFAVPIFTPEGFAAVLFGFGRRVVPSNPQLTEHAGHMGARLAVSLYRHLSTKGPGPREFWQPVSDTVLCRDCARWTPVAESHRPAGATHVERYCQTCWDLRCRRVG